MYWVTVPVSMVIPAPAKLGRSASAACPSGLAMDCWNAFSSAHSSTATK
jgi:hypothetical protein